MTTKIRVQCQECGKRFSTVRMEPECPRCRGGDIDLDYGQLTEQGLLHTIVR